MSRYQYQKPVNRPIYARPKFYVPGLFALIVILIYIAFIVITTINNNSSKDQPISGIQTSTVSDNKNTFTNSYFQFSDFGAWVLNKRISSSDHFVYEKYLGQELQGVLNVYVNQLPPEASLTATRVLPIRTVNDNSFQVTGVSDPCSNQFGAGEIHLVKQFKINGATMLCDPSSGIYTVIISQIDGDYRIGLQNSKGNQEQFIVSYRNDMVNPQPDTIVNVASSFKAL